MSTRANILVKDIHGDSLWFYRHSDGYPEGTLPTLQKFIKMITDGQIRNNVGQACGWLILIGHEEYGSKKGGWKIGAYEPTTGQHGDIEYLYTVDLGTGLIDVQHV
jgi:hypothetical protein